MKKLKEGLNHPLYFFVFPEVYFLQMEGQYGLAKYWPGEEKI